MMRRKILLCIPVILAVVFSLLATSLSAEQVEERFSTGNNVGFHLNLSWGGFGCDESQSLQQYPRNSGNVFGTDRGPVWTGIACRDRDGDGTAEDTVAVVDGGAAVNGGRWSIEAADVIQSFVDMGVDPRSKMSDLPYSQIWSSLDPDNLADWPVEAREGKSASGAPVLHGRETLFGHYQDVMTSYTNPPLGLYYGLSLYFLDYGQANDMVFGHVYWENVSEYIKYNSSYGSLGEEHPAGMTWMGIVIDHHLNKLDFGPYGTSRGAWALHAEKGIQVSFCKEPTLSSYTPSNPFMWGLVLTRPPTWKGQEFPFNNFHVSTNSSEFGVSPVKGSMASSLPHGSKYQALKGEYDYAPSVTNPFTGRTGLRCYPGYLEPTDARYNQWIWGGNSVGTIDMSFAEMKDFEPRDTVSWDFAYLYTYPGVTPMITPAFTIANIDDPTMQQALAPMEDMAAAAHAIFAGGLATPQTPKAPPLTIIPGDRQITITWSDVNVTTPDSFYYALQELGADPEGYYQEYDFAGYRLYRNFRGPNNVGAELIYDSDQEGVRFYHIDMLSDDVPYYRMKNGQKVWYALVPFDLNYRTEGDSAGTPYSLPLPGSARTWNSSVSRPGRTTDVVPRSDASNFKPAYVSGVEFYPALGNIPPIYASTYNIAGDGNGNLTEPLVYLAPWANISVTPVNAEKIKTQTVVNLSVDYGQGNTGPFNSWNYSRANIKFVLREGDFTAESGNIQGYGRHSGAHLGDHITVDLNGAIDNDGTSYALSADFQSIQPGSWRRDLSHWFDDGGYAADSVLDVYNSVEAALPTTKGAYTPSMMNYFRTATYKITWQDAGSGNLTVEVVDVSRGDTLHYVEYIDDGYGWGLVLTDEMFSGVGDHRYNGPGWNKPIANYAYGRYFIEAVRSNLPRSERTLKLHQTLPANNTVEFGIWIGGQYLKVEAPNDVVTAMPSPGTVFTFSRSYGAWNEDKTIFTEWAEPPFIGDRWVATIEPTTMSPEDADFSKIRVVPNPYVGSSFLDYSANARRIEFVNLPANCTVRIYSLGGNLVNVLNHIGSNRSGWGNYTDYDNLTLGVAPTYSGYDNHSGTEAWNMRNRFGQTVASGLYFYHVTDERGKTFTGRFYIIN